MIDTALKRIESRVRRRPLRAFVITGAPRTGTHMLNSVLCGSPLFHPLLTEAGLLVHLLRMREGMAANLKIGPNNYFSTLVEVDQLAASNLDGFVLHLHRRYGSPYIVLRAPILSRQLIDLQAVASHSRMRFDFLVLVRDPRDILCSLKTWSDRKSQSNGKHLDDDILAYATRTIRQSYSFLSDDLPANVHLYKYEDIVSDLPQFIERLAADLGISSKGLGCDTSWSNRVADLSPGNPILGPCVTDQYLSAVNDRSVGRYKYELTDAEIRMIEQTASHVMRRFGYSPE